MAVPRRRVPEAVMRQLQDSPLPLVDEFDDHDGLGPLGPTHPSDPGHLNQSVGFEPQETTTLRVTNRRLVRLSGLPGRDEERHIDRRHHQH